MLLTSCTSITDKKTSYIESHTAFFELKNGNWLANKWIRKPKNILEIHETFKKVGYENIIGNTLLSSPTMIGGLYVSKKGHNLLDSLVLTYKNRKLGTKYYAEFWIRREKEKNDSAVFVVLSDIKAIYTDKITSAKMQMMANNSKLNDTLRQLLKIEYRKTSLTKKLAIQDFETLKQLGFHKSAHNLLYEQTKYENINWNKDSLAKTLNCC